MADGTQRGFNFTRKALVSALRPGEIVVDFFAGGGGASEALRQALGRDPDVAVNHDHLAIGMHAANHPFTRHMEADVWTVDILREVAGRPVGWFHASPDCTHFSQAKGGQPRDRATRSLSWVVPKVAGKLARAGLAPRIISLENVRQILGWCPLVAKRDKTTGRVMKLDGTVAAPGESTPLREQFLVPDKKRAGQTWRQFVTVLRRLGYVVEWRLLKACDYGAGTSRERLFLIARRDGQPIVWPDPTHGPGRAQPFVTAADCIDWSEPCPSIFERKKPLADATCRRIAKGIHRYVLSAAEPYIVSTTYSGECHAGDRQHNGEQAHGLDHRERSGGCNAQGERERQPGACRPAVSDAAGKRGSASTEAGAYAGHLDALLLTEHANTSRSACWSAGEPLRTQCAQVKGGHFALAAAHLVKFRGESAGSDATDPMPTITSGAGAARPAGAAHAMGVLTAFLEQAHGGGEHGNPPRARGADEPVSTISTTGSQQRLVTAHLTAMAQNVPGIDPEQPLPTVLAGATRYGVVECTLSPEHEAGALRVAAFLMRYHGTGGQHAELGEPLTTVTTKDRLALVTVVIRSTPYVIVDIGLRMLKRHELFRAQGFPADYIIDRTADGTPLSISASVRMVGNSVSPPPLCAIARANLDSVSARKAIAA